MGKPARKLPSFLGKRRAKLRLSLRQVAEAAGVDASYLSLIERGSRRPEPAIVLRLARALDLDPLIALRAAFFDQLPRELRSKLPRDMAPSEADPDYEAARRHQRRHSAFEVEALRVAATVDWDGNLELVRTYEGCRPIAGAVWEMRFRERFPGVAPGAGPSPPARNILRAPARLEHEVRTSVAGDSVYHRVFFPKGWRRAKSASEDSLSFSFSTRHPKAYAVDLTDCVPRVENEAFRPLFEGSFVFHLTRFVRRLRIRLDLPAGYVPRSWEMRAWWGADPPSLVIDNLAGSGISRTLELKTRGSHAELVADEPLGGYSFAIVWIPPAYERYLEARARVLAPE